MPSSIAHTELKTTSEDVETPSISNHSNMDHEDQRRVSESHSEEDVEKRMQQDRSTEPAGLAPTYSRTSQIERTVSRRSVPFGVTAGLGEENFDIASKIESQQIRNEREATNGNDFDPNLVDWSGPDDPGNPMNCMIYSSFSSSSNLKLTR